MNKRQWVLLGIAAGVSCAAICRFVGRFVVQNRKKRYMSLSQHVTGNVSVSVDVVKEIIKRAIERIMGENSSRVDVNEFDGILTINVRVPQISQDQRQAIERAIHQDMKHGLGIDLPLDALNITTVELERINYQ